MPLAVHGVCCIHAASCWEDMCIVLLASSWWVPEWTATELSSVPAVRSDSRALEFVGHTKGILSLAHDVQATSQESANERAGCATTASSQHTCLAPIEPP